MQLRKLKTDLNTVPLFAEMSVHRSVCLRIAQISRQKDIHSMTQIPNSKKGFAVKIDKKIQTINVKERYFITKVSFFFYINYTFLIDIFKITESIRY